MRNETSGDLISRSALKAAVVSMNNNLSGVQMLIDNAPAVDAVSRLVVEHIKWERDTAIQQLKDHGIPFGGTAPDVVEVGSCDGCHWKEIGRQQKCSCCRRNRYLKDCYEGSEKDAVD